MLRGTEIVNGIDASVCALVNVVSKSRVRPPDTLTLIVLRPRLSFASTWNAMTVSTELEPADRATLGADLSANVLDTVVESVQAAAMKITAVAAKTPIARASRVMM